MISFATSILSFFIMFPIVCYFFVFIVCKQWTKKHRFSVHLALDVSTFFFIISVHFLMEALWGKSYLSYIMITILLIGIILVILHWKIKQEINYKKVFRGFWRVNFLLFFCTYLVLMVYGLIYFMITSVSFI
ncbi:DUF3397 domain-containing protein [Niallia sp. 01092]|uniref:DUF3397 domain-containing protein n=1 Tax=unclassified Niallia TaxID=2837522 RepID=UPI003FD10CB5